MIVVDTNVLSESIRSGGDDRVRTWLDAQDEESLFLASPVLAELLFGVEILPPGRRKEDIASAVRMAIVRRFRNRILVFDRPAAHAFAEIMALARRHGTIVSPFDGQIGAIAAANAALVATRDVAPFAALGVPTIDPWQPQPA